jgi:hypothetical protein
MSALLGWSGQCYGNGAVDHVALDFALDVERKLARAELGEIDPVA